MIFSSDQWQSPKQIREFLTTVTVINMNFFYQQYSSHNNINNQLIFSIYC